MEIFVYIAVVLLNMQLLFAILYLRKMQNEQQKRIPQLLAYNDRQTKMLEHEAEVKEINYTYKVEDIIVYEDPKNHEEIINQSASMGWKIIGMSTIESKRGVTEVRYIFQRKASRGHLRGGLSVEKSDTGPDQTGLRPSHS